MGKRFILSMVIVLCACSLFAQAPERFSYQAVVRNDSSKLVCNRPVGVQASILNDAGSLLYRERHVEETNENGLLTLEIGYGNAQEGSFSDIPWGSESVFLRMEIDPTGGENYVLSITQRLVSVPYALYAKEAANGFSGDYNDLTNRPTIPTVPTNVSAFTNDAGYITISSVPTVPTNVSAFTNDAGYLTGYTETDPQFNAWDKDYNDLINTPTIPTVPTNVSAFTNDAGYITMSSVPTVPTEVSAFNNDAGYLTSYTETDPQFNAWDKDYNDLINTPVIPTVPTNVSDFVNDAGYLTGYVETDPHFDEWNLDYNALNNKPSIPTVPTNVSAFTNDAGYITMDSVQTVPTNVSAFVNDAGYLTGYTEIDPQFNAWDKNYNDLTNKPEIFSGDYNDLTNKPALFSGSYNDLTNKPANVDFGHALVRGTVNNPAGATDINVTFTNYTLVTGGMVSIVFARNVPAGASLNINSQGSKPILWRGTTLGDGVIKANDRCLFMYNSGGGGNYYLLAIDRWGVDIDALADVAWTGNYNDLTNKPTIPTVPTNVSAFVNDVGYLTAIPDSLGVISIESDPVFSAWDRDYYDLTNLPELFSGDYNDLTNKPTLFSGNYNDLVNQPDLFSGSYNDLTDKPNLFSGNYNDLTNKPTNADFGQALVRGTVNNPAGATDISVTFTNYSLVSGGIVSIVFARNVPAGASLNINSQGLKPILWRGATLTDGVIKANDRCLFMYQASADSYFLLAIDRWGVDIDAFATVARTGNYNDLTNKPTIPTVPTNVSEFVNDAGYLTAHQDISGKANIADLSTVAFSGSYNDLTNKPSIPNDNNLVHLTGNETITGSKTLTSDLLLKNPESSTGRTPYFTFQRGTLTDGYVDWKIDNDAGKLQFFYSTSGNDNKKLEMNNSVALFSTNVEASQFIKTGGTSTQFLKADGSVDGNTYLTNQDISGKANIADLASVAFSGNYNDLSNRPTIPTALSDLENDAGYVSAAQCEGLDVCALANLVAALQQQMSAMQATIDSLLDVPDGYACPGVPTVTDYDGNTYNTVHIGNQCWMKENLRTTHFADGTPISGGGQLSSPTTPYYYNYGNIPLESRGYLYNWPAAMHSAESSSDNPSGVQGICPMGWHLPSDVEWSQLTDYLSGVPEYQCGGNSSNIAKALASTSGWGSHSGDCTVGNNQNENNVTGFAAVPTGNFGGSSVLNSGSKAFLWSSTMVSGSNAWYRAIFKDNAEVIRGGSPRSYGYSVRCLRN